MLDVLAGDACAERVLGEAGAALGRDLRKLARSAGEIYRNRIAQPLLCVAQMATWAALRGHLPSPRVFAGYSVGELAAYGCAGSLSATEMVRLARERARLMDGACERRGSLVAARGLPREQVEALCRQTGAEIAIINACDRFVIGGDMDVIGNFRDVAEELGALITPLPVEVAAHTTGLATAGAAFRELLEESDLTDPAIPVMSGVHAVAVHRRDEAIDVLSEQISTTIDWSACLGSLAELGSTVLLELGPGNALSGMARDVRPEFTARSVADFRSLSAVADWVATSLRRAGGH